MPKTFKTAKTTSDEGTKWEDDLPFGMKDIRDVAKNDFRQIRLVGFVEPFMRFWIPTEASKAYDPYKTKAKQYPSVCVDFDPEEEVFVGNDCLYRKAHYKYVDPESGEERWGRLKPTKNYLIFFIDRERQEERSGISLKKKYMNAVKMSDIQCATVPTAFAREVQGAIEMYAKKAKAEVDPTDAADGYDLFFKFDSEAKAEAKYKIQLGDPSPLTKEELKQLELLPETINIFPKDNPEKIRSSLERAGYVIVEKGEDPEDVLEARKSKKSQKRAVKAGAELLDDDEDEEETPRKGRKAAPVADDDFDDEDDDLNLEDEGTEDEAPAKSKAKADDDFEDEDEEETPAPKAEKKSKKAAKPKADDDDDDFDFDDEDF